MVIPIHAGFEVVSPRVGKGSTSLLLGFVDHLSGICYLDQSRETEGAADHVLNQAFDSCLVSRGQKDGLAVAAYSCRINF